MISSNRSSIWSRICRCRERSSIGPVEDRLNVTSYGPAMMCSGPTNPYFALKITHASPKRSAYSLFTLKGAPTYASRADVGPAAGFLSQIFARPQGTMTRTPDGLTTHHLGRVLDIGRLRYIGVRAGLRNDSNTGHLGGRDPVPSFLDTAAAGQITPAPWGGLP